MKIQLKLGCSALISRLGAFLDNIQRMLKFWFYENDNHDITDK